jgi:hypothetical protein
VTCSVLKTNRAELTAFVPTVRLAAIVARSYLSLGVAVICCCRFPHFKARQTLNEFTYLSNCFSPSQKSTLPLDAVILGAHRGLAGKYTSISRNTRQLNPHSVNSQSRISCISKTFQIQKLEPTNKEIAGFLM